MSESWKKFRTCCRTPAGRVVCWFLIFTLLALVDAVQTFAAQEFEDMVVPWSVAFRRSFESNYLCAVLGLGVLWLAGRWPLERGRLLTWFSLHFALSLLFAAAYALVLAWILDGQVNVKGELFQFRKVVVKLLVFYTPAHVAVYWIILLAHNGWHFYGRYRERERRAAELEGQLARAQLEALRMQINPHFLFNTLNTIAALIHDQPDAADRMLTRLSELLRLSLERTDAQEIPLRQELHFLDRYLEIEQARFGDRLHVAFEIPEALREVLVPSLILQPIVENSIRHGVEQREEAGRILIRAAAAGGNLELTVADNGPGLPSGRNTFAREGIGLSNTRSRLRHLYGECQSVELGAADGGGLLVRITLPLRKPGDPTPEPGSPAVVVGCNTAPAAT
jgi:signal transduction histidine kinase